MGEWSKGHKHKWHQVDAYRREWIYENFLLSINSCKRQIDQAAELGLTERVENLQGDLRALEIAYNTLRDLEAAP